LSYIALLFLTNGLVHYADSMVFIFYMVLWRWSKRL